MTAILINDAEWSLLAGEPAELLKLYVAIKRRMDFATGIAGRKTLLNEIVLREGFTVDPIPGRPSPKPVTREQYRSAVRRLEKLGALSVIGPLVFEFPHARKDTPPKRATTELQPDLQPELQPNPASPQAPNPEGLSHGAVAELQPEQHTGVGLSNNLLPESGFLPTTRFPMHDGWEPSARGWKATAMRNGLGPVTATTEQLQEFVSYWINRDEKYQSQGQWEHELAQKLKREARHAQRTGLAQTKTTQNSANGSSSGRKGSVSAVGRVEQAIQRNRTERANAAGGRQTPGTNGNLVVDDGADLRPPLDGEFRREPNA